MNNMHGGVNMMPVMNQGMPGVGMMQQNSPQQPPMQMPPGVPMPAQPINNPNPNQMQQQNIHLDNIAKIKASLAPLKESLQNTLKSAAAVLQKNSSIDNLKRDNCEPPKFEKHLEDFYSICDQIELHLITASNCMQQQNSAQKYLPGNIASLQFNPAENQGNVMSYSHYLNTVRSHVSSAKDLHDTFISAAQNISSSD